MKRPLSPSHSPENGLRLVEPASGQPEQRLKREKKQQSFTLCEVCNIQLNSAAQAQIHYNGKSHQKRLKQLNKGKMPAAQGRSLDRRCPKAALALGQLLPWVWSGRPPPCASFPFQMDPVQKAVISHTFGVPTPLKKKQFISCNICHLRFNSANQAEAHYKGHKHARRLKAIEAMKSKQKAAAGASGRDSAAEFVPSPEGSGDPSSTGTGAAPLGSPPASELSEGASDATGVTSPATQVAESGGSIGSAPESEKEGKKSKQHLYCPTCKVTVNSLSQLEAHNTGAKHKSMLEGHSTQMRRGRGKLLSRAGHKSKRIGNKGSINIQNKAFHCQVCEIYVNSETQLKQHMSSRRHKDRLAGKPPKPKYSPYNKLQKNAALASKLALQKHLTKTLATRFLPSPLTTAVCAVPGPLALRPAAATTLFQAPLLGPALFRTPPAHVRTTPGPIVFAPY
uniref:Zinc finger protein 385C n=1 Tax=Anas platyrhynchos platyrhynchos TaxID=8840 RepID=U3I506_ANAPP